MPELSAVVAWSVADRGDHRVEVLPLLQRVPLRVERRDPHIEAIYGDEPRPLSRQVPPGDDVRVLRHPVSRHAAVTLDGVRRRPSAGAALDDRHADLVGGGAEAQAAAGDVDQRLRLRPQDEVVVACRGKAVGRLPAALALIARAVQPADQLRP